MGLAHKATPQAVKPFVLETSARWGRLSAQRRMVPDFLIAGGQRCGTTSMYRTLSQHPTIIKPVLHKGVHYFDMHYDRSFNWYRGHFALESTGRRLTRREDSPALTFESSPYYLSHPLAASRIAADLPDAKLLVMVRDPVERAYSAHAHELARGYETLPFDKALAAEDERLDGVSEQMIADPLFRSHSHQHHAYRSRGRYIEHLRRVTRYIPRESVHVVDSHRFFADPEPVYDEVLEFLGVPNLGYPTFDRHNARPRSDMDPGLRSELENYFEPYDEELATWLGWQPSWRA